MSDTTTSDIDDKEPNLVMSNPLVVILGISRYTKQQNQFHDLPFVKEDIKTLRRTWYDN